MKVYLIFFGVLLGLCSTSAGQSNEVNPNIIKMVDSVKIAFCNKDTTEAITLLEKIEILYPTDGLIATTNRALADLYITRNKGQEAKAKLLYAFNYTPTNYPVLGDPGICDRTLNNYFFLRTKADICVDLSQLYLRQKQYDSSLYFLTLADTEFLPYAGCANGIYMYRSYLSTYFADYYLTIGDTTKAIARLLDFFMKRDGNTVLLTTKLKSILLQKWTPDEIAGQVDKGLRELLFVKGEDDEFTINLTLFGHTIKDYGYGKTNVYRSFYINDPSLKMLRGD